MTPYASSGPFVRFLFAKLMLPMFVSALDVLLEEPAPVSGDLELFIYSASSVGDLDTETTSHIPSSLLSTVLRHHLRQNHVSILFGSR